MNTTEAAMEKEMFGDCENALDVLGAMLRDDRDDRTDAPTWGEIPADCRDALRTATVWSWDADGVVIGFDGSYSDDEPGIYLAWDEIRRHQASECPLTLHRGPCRHG